MKKYVVGFMCYADQVALIRKVRPKWQEGLLNGIGGHIEKNETPIKAMIREFQEETGHLEKYWREYCVMQGTGWKVHCFVSIVNIRPVLKTTTDEMVMWETPGDETYRKMIPNLRFLIPMANYKEPITSKIKYLKLL